MDWELFWIIGQRCRRQSRHCNNISFCPKLMLKLLAAVIQLLQTVKSVLCSQNLLLTPCKATLHSFFQNLSLHWSICSFQHFLSREMQMVLFKFETKDNIFLIMITLQIPHSSVRDYFRFHVCVHWFNGINQKVLCLKVIGVEVLLNRLNRSKHYLGQNRSFLVVFFAE